MKVPTKSYRRQYAPILSEVLAAFEHVLLNDKPVLGAAVGAFEEELAAAHGVDFSVGVNSGTDAAVLLYRALGVGAGDEVITCAHTFSGVVSAILLAGATPVLVDGDPQTGALTAAAAERAFTERTRAICGVHLYGAPLAADALAELARRRGVDFIEDTAQAHAARWRDQPVGCFGRAAVTSFHPSKNLGAFGDAGAVMTDDVELVKSLRVLRNLGKVDKYAFETVAPNSKLDTLQAALLSVRLRHLPQMTDRRRKIARRYLEGLAGLPGLQLPAESADAEPVWHLFVVRVDHRDALREHLTLHGVATGLHYPIAVHQQPGLASYFKGQRFPVAEAFAQECLSLPCSPEHTDAEIDHVITTIRGFKR